MLGTLLFLLVGYALYRSRWPDGFFTREDDSERVRLARIGRRRIAPVPRRREIGR